MYSKSSIGLKRSWRYSAGVVLGEGSVRLATGPVTSAERAIVYLPEGMKPTVLSIEGVHGTIEPALYAIDVALPVIDLGQESRCAPGRTARAELAQGTPVSAQSDWRWFEGVAMWRWAHAIYALLGAILSALAVITFSGIMKPKDD